MGPACKPHINEHVVRKIWAGQPSKSTGQFVLRLFNVDVIILFKVRGSVRDINRA